jgi:hypothetical protein
LTSNENNGSARGQCCLLSVDIPTNCYPSKNKTLSRKDENLALIAVIYIWNMFSNVKMIKSVSIRIQNAEVIKSVLVTNRSYRPLTRNRKKYIYRIYLYK